MPQVAPLIAGLEICIADITSLVVDAIVNAAGRYLAASHRMPPTITRPLLPSLD
jgi:hypothetical protein